jgi:hypothetical protein
LSPGAEYRLVFVTGATTSATSPDIADYNAFVTGFANSVVELAALATSWTAIASTDAIDARDNTGTNPTDGMGVPIYRLDGTLIATSNQDLWDDTLLAPISYTETGVHRADVIGVPHGIEETLVWTGTNDSGAAACDFYLGADGGGAVTGQWTDKFAPWIVASLEPTDSQMPLYAISGVLTFVPEPAAVVLLWHATAGLAVWATLNLKQRASGRRLRGQATQRF